jgi:hypothetical protein
VRAIRVLLSARDPASAAQARPLVEAIRAEPRIALTVAASEPALERLADAEPVRFELPGGATHVPPGESTAPLLAAAEALLERVDPDVLVVGISSLGVGLDEALLARAGGRPTFALQDYPGDASAIDGAYAGTYLVRDEAAARLTTARLGVPAAAVGSLRHAGYARLDVPRLRAETRARLGAGAARPVVGFFAQPPDIPGHEAAFGDLVAALGPHPSRPLVLVREHPKSPERRAPRVQALRAAGIAVRDTSEELSVEPSLAACDVVTTCFSHCSIDYAFLSAWSAEPIGSVLFLLTSEETRRFVRSHLGLPAPDGVEAGLGLVAERPGSVGAMLSRALGAGERRAYHEASRRLPRECRLDAIIAALLEAGRRAARRTGARA